MPASFALGSGYGEAKWIAEEIVLRTSLREGIPGAVVRLGQVCGDKFGHWNEKEWFPAMVKSGLFARCLPDIDSVNVSVHVLITRLVADTFSLDCVAQTAAFIPSYPAARAFIEMRHSSSPVLHLSHSRPVDWTTLMQPIAEELGVPLVPLARWVDALTQIADSENNSGPSRSDVRRNPALALLGLFRSWANATGSQAGPVSALNISTEKAQSASETLRHLPVLSAEAAKAWVAAWRKSGFLEE